MAKMEMENPDRSDERWAASERMANDEANKPPITLKNMKIIYLSNKKDRTNTTYNHQSVHSSITCGIQIRDIMNMAVMSRLVID